MRRGKTGEGGFGSNQGLTGPGVFRIARDQVKGEAKMDFITDAEIITLALDHFYQAILVRCRACDPAAPPG